MKQYNDQREKAYWKIDACDVAGAEDVEDINRLVLCPNCGFKVSAEEKECFICGTRLPERSYTVNELMEEFGAFEKDVRYGNGGACDQNPVFDIENKDDEKPELWEGIDDIADELNKSSEDQADGAGEGSGKKDEGLLW